MSSIKSFPDPDGDLIKALEAEFEGPIIPVDKPWVVRLDGRSFSTFCKSRIGVDGQKIQKPFDPGLSDLMFRVACHLVEEWSADFVYTQSDEISLFFRPSDNPRSELPFGGRTSKIITSMATSATLEFSSGFQKCLGFTLNETVRPTFDARAFSCPDWGTFKTAFTWRVDDCRRNSVSQLARYTLGHSACQGLSSRQLIDKMNLEHGVDWYRIATRFSYGMAAARLPVELFTPEGAAYTRKRLTEVYPSAENFDLHMMNVELN